MKSAEEQLSTYKSVHLNKRNVFTHFIGVPAIIWSLALLMSLISTQVDILDARYTVNFAMLFFGLTLLYYFKLHFRLSIGLFLFILPVVYSTQKIALSENALLIAMAVFIVGWIIQFIGHAYEKAKPAFIDDLNQLLIGPFFLMAEIYFMLGFEKTLEKTITPMAVKKRRAIEESNKKNST
jgi:uncharacterized membrane protein YGL010W